MDGDMFVNSLHQFSELWNWSNYWSEVILTNTLPCTSMHTVCKRLIVATHMDSLSSSHYSGVYYTLNNTLYCLYRKLVYILVPALHTLLALKWGLTSNPQPFVTCINFWSWKSRLLMHGNNWIIVQGVWTVDHWQMKKTGCSVFVFVLLLTLTDVDTTVYYYMSGECI